MGADKLRASAPKFAGEDYIHIVVAGSDAGTGYDQSKYKQNEDVR